MWLQGAPEKGVIMFKTTCVQCRVRLEPEHVQTLHLSVQPNPDSMEQWQPEEMQVGGTATASATDEGAVALSCSVWDDTRLEAASMCVGVFFM